MKHARIRQSAAIFSLLTCSCAVQLPDEIPMTIKRSPPGDEKWPDSHYFEPSSIVEVLSRPSDRTKPADTPMRRLAVEAAQQCEAKLGRIRREMKNARNTRDALTITAGVVGALGGFSATILASAQALRPDAERDTGLDVGAAVSGGVAVVAAIIGIISPTIAEPENLRPEHARAKGWYTKAKMEAVALSSMSEDDEAYDAQLRQLVISLYGCETEPDNKSTEIVEKALALSTRKRLPPSDPPRADGPVGDRKDEPKQDDPKKEEPKKDLPRKDEPKK
jgi:hypothetical protein